MNFTMRMLGERSQTKNMTYCMIPLMWNLTVDRTNQWWEMSEQQLPCSCQVLTVKGTREPAGRMKMFYNLVWVIVAQMYTHLKIHWTVFLRSLYFTICYFNLKEQTLKSKDRFFLIKMCSYFVLVGEKHEKLVLGSFKIPIRGSKAFWDQH